ncbi:MAG: ATP-binding protein, partial [Hyphomicrobiales bacterium]|nr:ATP-binding protein [Hyphomicrobiales bacterium]
ADLIVPPPAEGSAAIAERVAAARKIQTGRYQSLGLPYRTNAECSAGDIEEIGRPDNGGMQLLRDFAEAVRLSARGYHRVLKVGRTLADLDGAERVGRIHIAEALNYRAITDRLPAAA